MTEKENDDFLIDIEKSDDVTRIRISGFKKNEFDQAYRMATHLTHRAKELDIAIEEENRLSVAKKEVNYLWTQEDTEWKLDEAISDASYRIALALLRTYPQCKKQTDVVKMTKVPQKTVSNHLSGKLDSTRIYFCKCNNR